MNKKGFLSFYVIGIMVVVVMLSSLAYYFLKKDSSTLIPNDTESAQDTITDIDNIDKKVPLEPINSNVIAPKNTSGYTFTIIGLVRDVTDAPAMTPGTPMAGIVIRGTGPKTVTTQTQSNGSYKLSFTNAPVGTYSVCITIPSQYGTNPPSGCEAVIVRLSEKYDKTLELTVNGNVALHGTAVNFNIFREQATNSSTNDNEPSLLLKSIGINLDYYDSVSNKAGDFVFTKENLQFNRLFMPYGFFIPSSSASPDKYNPQPTFILPLGTPVRSLVDGVVANIPTLWSGDYSIQVTANGKLEKWIYETEHIINPKVKVGDKVEAGQILGEVSNFDRGAPAGFGAVEIGILKGGNPPQHVCPFAYLDPSIKQDIEKKIIAFYKAWEEYVGDQTLYDESAATPGCLRLDPIDG